MSKNLIPVIDLCKNPGTVGHQPAVGIKGAVMPLDPLEVLCLITLNNLPGEYLAGKQSIPDGFANGAMGVLGDELIVFIGEQHRQVKVVPGRRYHGVDVVQLQSLKENLIGLLQCVGSVT